MIIITCEFEAKQLKKQRARTALALALAVAGSAGGVSVVTSLLSESNDFRHEVLIIIFEDF
jgi:hypothetical protein